MSFLVARQPRGIRTSTSGFPRQASPASGPPVSHRRRKIVTSSFSMRAEDHPPPARFDTSSGVPVVPASALQSSYPDGRLGRVRAAGQAHPTRLAVQGGIDGRSCAGLVGVAIAPHSAAEVDVPNLPVPSEGILKQEPIRGSSSTIPTTTSPRPRTEPGSRGVPHSAAGAAARRRPPPATSRRNLLRWDLTGWPYADRIEER